MNKIELENNLKEIIELYNSLQKGTHDLFKWVKEKWKERIILDDFLNFINIENNEETRFAAYSRISGLRENPLELYLENNDFSEIEKREILDNSYRFVCVFYSEIQAVIIMFIETKKLLSSFYLEVFKGVANVGLAFNEFFIPWRNHIIYDINKNLEEKFNNDSDKIIGYLSENNLFDKWHENEITDRSYSALVWENWKYISKSYLEVFGKEVNEIVKELDVFINKLSKLEDEIYNAKQNYIDYLTAIKNAFLETNTNKLVEKWSLVDETRMQIKTPFQIGHPLEFYEDKYRKAVAPEWDLRIQNKVFESDVEISMLNMYETFYDEIWKENYNSSYNFSLDNQKRVQLYLSSPVLYYSSFFTWLFSAQVVPNDEVMSKKYWKKIFAFPEMVLESKRSEPFMKLSSETLEEKFLHNYRKSLYWENKNFYKIYDIETIGHEYWHTLWLDTDTEIKMNEKTWTYKNLEEFKATTGGLVMYFLNENLALNLKEELIIHHIIRCIWLLKYREVNEILPYYSEALIHLFILFESWIIIENLFKKIELIFNDETYNNLKQEYIKHYKLLINIYLEKRDSWEFLWDYIIKKDWNYLPKKDSIREFVEYYYSVYKNIWNKIDESILKEKYLK